MMKKIRENKKKRKQKKTSSLFLKENVIRVLTRIPTEICGNVVLLFDHFRQNVPIDRLDGVLMTLLDQPGQDRFLLLQIPCTATNADQNHSIKIHQWISPTFEHQSYDNKLMSFFKPMNQNTFKKEKKKQKSKKRKSKINPNIQSRIWKKFH